MKNILPVVSGFVTTVLLTTVLLISSCTNTGTEQCPCDKDPEPKNEYARELKAKDHFLDSVTAGKWIARYQEYSKLSGVTRDTAGQKNTDKKILPQIAAPAFPKESESFNRALIQQILCLENCIGVRVLFGINDNNEVRLMLGGIDQEGNLLYITDASAEGKSAGVQSTGRAAAPPAIRKKGLGEMGQIP